MPEASQSTPQAAGDSPPRFRLGSMFVVVTGLCMLFGVTSVFEVNPVHFGMGFLVLVIVSLIAIGLIELTGKRHRISQQADEQGVGRVRRTGPARTSD